MQEKQLFPRPENVLLHQVNFKMSQKEAPRAENVALLLDIFWLVISDVRLAFCVFDSSV